MNTQFFPRALVYICAFIGAGMFGDISYNSPWSNDFVYVLVPAVIVGVLAAIWRGRSIRTAGTTTIASPSTESKLARDLVRSA